MPKFTIFEIFIIVHLIVDFIFQRKWEATRKNKDWFALALHCFVYTIGFVPAFWFLKISFYWLFLLFISHFIIDNQKLVRLFLEELKGYKQNESSPALWRFLFLGVDQILHLIVLVIITAFA